jgi:uncharacterized UBP type Zn finger protein
MTCSHRTAVRILDVPERIEGRDECLAAGMRRVHLRMCRTCGHIGCCDNSSGRHATAQFSATSHPIIRSVEPGETWSWCYVDEVVLMPGAR